MVSEPENLRIESDGVRIEWDDGHQGYYPHWYLRASCRCADCLAGADRNPTLFYESIERDVKALDWMPVGRYAATFLWSDGHETGIYAFETLRQTCHCRECRASAMAENSQREGCPKPKGP